VFPIREAKRLRTVFPEAVCERLAIVGVAAGDFPDERARMSEMAFGRTRNARGSRGVGEEAGKERTKSSVRGPCCLTYNARRYTLEIK
jgi:hypothetical protein